MMKGAFWFITSFKLLPLAKPLYQRGGDGQGREGGVSAGEARRTH